MRKASFFVPLILTLILVTGCRGKSTFEPPTNDYPLRQLDPAYEVDPALFIDGSNLYALSLIQNPDLTDANETIVVSPPNLYVQAFVFLNAASGPTYDGIAEHIGLTFPDHSPVNAAANMWVNQATQTPGLRFGNGIFMVWPIKLEEPFARRMAETFDADIIKLGAAGIAAQEGIDAWSTQRTLAQLKGLNQDLERERDIMISLTTASLDAKVTSETLSATNGTLSITAFPLQNTELLFLTLDSTNNTWPTLQEFKDLIEQLSPSQASLTPSITLPLHQTDFVPIYSNDGMEELTEGPLDLRYLALELSGIYNFSQMTQTVELGIEGEKPLEPGTKFAIVDPTNGLILFIGQTAN